MQYVSAGHPVRKQRLIANSLARLVSCISGKESKSLFFQTKTQLQVNICSISAWFLSNIDLLMRNTQLSAKPECVIIIQRGSGYILCDSLAMAVGRPWPGSLVDPALQSVGTWCKYWARSAFKWWPQVLLQNGCYQAGTATGAPYHTKQWMTAVLLHNERGRWCIAIMWHSNCTYGKQVSCLLDNSHTFFGELNLLTRGKREDSLAHNEVSRSSSKAYNCILTFIMEYFIADIPNCWCREVDSWAS